LQCSLDQPTLRGPVLSRTLHRFGRCGRLPPCPSASPSEIRAWARARGFIVSDRGRLPADVVIAWEPAQDAAATSRSQRPIEGQAPAVDAAEDRRSALEELGTVADKRLHVLEEQVDALTARLAEVEGKRKRATILRRRARA
jgi:hypothetical protein